MGYGGGFGFAPPMMMSPYGYYPAPSYQPQAQAPVSASLASLTPASSSSVTSTPAPSSAASSSAVAESKEDRESTLMAKLDKQMRAIQEQMALLAEQNVRKKTREETNSAASASALPGMASAWKLDSFADKQQRDNTPEAVFVKASREFAKANEDKFLDFDTTYQWAKARPPTTRRDASGGSVIVDDGVYGAPQYETMESFAIEDEMRRDYDFDTLIAGKERKDGKGYTQMVLAMKA